MSDLLGASTELDRAIHELGFLSSYHRSFHPANAGDVSQVLGEETASVLLERANGTMSRWYELSELESLAELRRDGRTGYRTQGIKFDRFYQLLAPLAGRMILITRTGAQLPAIASTIRMQQDGKLLNLVQLDNSARRIRVVYGHDHYGSIPSIETHVHLVSNAISVSEGEQCPGTVHAHPPKLVDLGRHPSVAGRFEEYNAVIYTSIEGLNRNYPDLIGVIPYRPSGSEALVRDTVEALHKHRIVLWMNHGLLVRASDIRQAYMLLAYAEESARAALFSLQVDAVRLPEFEVLPFLESNGLIDAYQRVFMAVEPPDAPSRLRASRTARR